MQGGGGSYIGAVAEPHACCKEMDLSEGLWNSAGGASLTAPAPSVHYHIRTKCVCVCKAPWRQQVQPKQYPIWEFFKIQTHVSSTHAHLLPLRQPLHRELSNCLWGFKLALRRQPRDYSASTKIHICCRSGKKNKQTLPHYPSPRIYTRSSQTSFEQHCEGGKGSVCVCVCGGGVFATVAFNHVPFYWFESGSNLVSGLCKVLCCIKSRP